MPTDRFAFTPNLVVGLSLIFLGVALTLDRLDIVPAAMLLRWWPLLLILFGASLVVQAWRGVAAEGSGNGAERPMVSPGFVLFLAIAVLVVTQVSRRGETAAAGRNGDTVSLFAVMTSEERTTGAADFRGGEVTSLMGRARVDLRDATLAPGDEAVLDVLTVMGRLELLVPPDWTVDVEAPRVMGRIRDERPRRTTGDPPPASIPAPPDAIERADPAATGLAPPRVVVRGLVLMGGVRIRS